MLGKRQEHKKFVYITIITSAKIGQVFVFH